MQRAAALIVVAVLVASWPARAAGEDKATAKHAPPLEVVVVAAMLAEVAEIEPNDSPAQAQTLDCGTTLRPAAIDQPSATRDTDWVAFTATAGDLITLSTDADPSGPSVDTVLGLIAADGTTVLARDDDSGPGLYSAIAEFCAPYTGRYFAAVRGFRDDHGAYRLDVSCSAGPGVPVNDQCAGAIALPCGTIDLSGNSLCATDDASPGVGATDPFSCTGSYAPGRDVFFRIEVAAAGEAIEVDYQVTPASADAAIYLVTDCDNVLGTCLAGQDAASGTPTERLVYTFPQAGTYYLVLDAFRRAGGAWTLAGLRSCNSTPTRKMTWGRLKTVYR